MATMSDNKPWYRQLWPWLIMVPPAAAVVAGLVTLYLAASQPPAMVAGEYDAQRMSTLARSAREDQARVLGLSAHISLDTSGDQDATGIRVELNAATLVQLPDQVRVRLVHRTLLEEDREAWLTRSGNAYTGLIQRPRGRLWLELEDDRGTWRLAAELDEDQNRVSARPSPASG